MGLLFRTSQTACFVSALEPTVILPPPDTKQWPGPDPDWLPAAGQPASCDRVEVRALSPAQWAELLEMWKAEDPAATRAIVGMGVVSIGGQPVAFDDLAEGWGQLLANLVAAVSAVPMVGRRSRSTDGQ